MEITNMGILKEVGFTCPMCGCEYTAFRGEYGLKIKDNRMVVTCRCPKCNVKNKRTLLAVSDKEE